MENRQAGTNAADSAPGVNDGPATGRAPDPMTRPGGRGKVWLAVAAVLALLVVVFLARPAPEEGGQAMVGPATSQAEIETSTVPGAANSAPTSAPQP